jgi:hypothetical protein
LGILTILGVVLTAFFGVLSTVPPVRRWWEAAWSPYGRCAQIQRLAGTWPLDIWRVMSGVLVGVAVSLAAFVAFVLLMT